MLQDNAEALEAINQKIGDYHGQTLADLLESEFGIQQDRNMNYRQAERDLDQFELDEDEDIDGERGCYTGTIGALNFVKDYCSDLPDEQLDNPCKVANWVDYIRAEEELHIIVENYSYEYCYNDINDLSAWVINDALDTYVDAEMC